MTCDGRGCDRTATGTVTYAGAKVEFCPNHLFAAALRQALTDAGNRPLWNGSLV